MTDYVFVSSGGWEQTLIDLRVNIDSSFTIECLMELAGSLEFW